MDLPLESRREQDKRGLHKRVALPAYIWPYVVTCCYMTAGAHVLPHVVIFCNMLPTFSRESSLGGIAALLQRPGLSRTHLEASDSEATERRHIEGGGA